MRDQSDAPGFLCASCGVWIEHAGYYYIRGQAPADGVGWIGSPNLNQPPLCGHCVGWHSYLDGMDPGDGYYNRDRSALMRLGALLNRLNYEAKYARTGQRPRGVTARRAFQLGLRYQRARAGFAGPQGRQDQQ